MKALRRIVPERMKCTVKARILHSLHAQPEIVARVAGRVTGRGVPNYVSWDFAAEKRRLLDCIEKRRSGPFSFRFSASAPQPTAYASAYVCMILGLLGELDSIGGRERAGWLAYFDALQGDDGFFRDPVLLDGGFETGGSWGGGWGMWHLASHLAIVYGRLGGVPARQLVFLEPFFDSAHLAAWLSRFDFSSNVWGQSNHIMNLFTLLEFARDFMGQTRADAAIRQISEWLLSRQNPETGMWHYSAVTSYPALGDAIRGAYHFYPLFTYEGIEIPQRARSVDAILSSQNSWGAFAPENCPSGACEDIDALEPLVRFSLATGHRREEAVVAARRALVWIFSCRGDDGGYESIPLNGCAYGDHPSTTSLPGESNLFATWFRTLTIAYLAPFAGLASDYRVGRFPGYEISMKVL